MEFDISDEFSDMMLEFRRQLEETTLIQAYQGLIQYIRDLKRLLQNKYPEYIVPSSTYFGYLDMTYFSFTPKSLAEKKLKIAVVFNYETFSFEVWLSGGNRSIQNRFWSIFNKQQWTKYQLTSPGTWVDSILTHTITTGPDFEDLDQLTQQIESGIMNFVKDVEDFLVKHQE